MICPNCQRGMIGCEGCGEKIVKSRPGDTFYCYEEDGDISHHFCKRSCWVKWILEDIKSGLSKVRFP